MSTKHLPLNTAASCYGISESELQPLEGGHFTHVYGFAREARSYVLRLTPPSADTDLERQRAILAWMAYLADHGAFVPEPLPSQDGRLVEIIPSPDDNWLVVAFTRAEGILSEELSLDQWDDGQFQVLGKSIGKMHAIARGYAPSKEMTYPDWKNGGNLFSHALQNEFGLKEKQSFVLEQIRSLPKTADAYGLIHCDLHFGNFFLDIPRQKITLIDFDDCAYGWFVMDIAVLLFDILVLYTGSDKDAYGRYFLRNFLAGYLAETPLSHFWLEQLPIFLKLLEINVYDMVARSYPAEADEWVTKFMAGRKERLENDIPYIDLDIAELPVG
jgi:Ser/Thr protein kinase RdoA (MazF antagonist)